jgi:hypothetical protein
MCCKFLRLLKNYCEKLAFKTKPDIRHRRKIVCEKLTIDEYLLTLKEKACTEELVWFGACLGGTIVLMKDLIWMYFSIILMEFESSMCKCQ